MCVIASIEDKSMRVLCGILIICALTVTVKQKDAPSVSMPYNHLNY